MTVASPHWLDTGLLSDIPPARRPHRAYGDVAVLRTASDEVFALDDRCPHKGGPLSQGIIHGAHVTCPLRNWVISLRSGTAEGADSGCTATYSVRIENGRVLRDATQLHRRRAA